MMRRCIPFLLSLLLIPGNLVLGQHNYPAGYFRSPVDFAVNLAGSFGEIRRNHFHSGIDIRTDGVVGKPVYAAADGYVSRINVSSAGFGKALYIAHPNGYTTLYGHLLRYAGAIASWVRTQQYRQESFAMDTEVPPGLLKVKKGELVAYSGNSGASGGPHLHFEVRDSKTQEIIDPLDFGFIKAGGASPDINWVKIYPYDDHSMVNFTGNPVLVPVTGTGDTYRLKTEDTVMVSGNIIFGIETIAIAEGGMKTGVHNISLSVDGATVFTQSIDRFAFAETRYVNSLMDYPDFVKHGRKIQRSYVAPNNKLSVYSEVKNRGILNFVDSRPHKIRYSVKDAFGKTSALVFWVKSHPPANIPGGLRTSGNGLPVFTYRNDNRFTGNGMKLDVPKEAVYEDFPFEYHETPPVRGSYAPVYGLQDEYTPLHTWCTLSIKTENLPKNLASKAVIVEVGRNNAFISKGGTWENGWITTKIRDFGNFTVSVDNEPPRIRPVNVLPNKKVRKQSSILVKIYDNLSGIKSYRGTLNGKWILMDFDEKSHLLSYSFDERMKPGRNLFVLVVTDAVGNSARYEAALIR